VSLNYLSYLDSEVVAARRDAHLDIDAAAENWNDFNTDENLRR
jgi:hypothetical protein